MGPGSAHESRYIEEAESLCHRVGIVDHGRLIALGTPSELKGGLGNYCVEFLDERGADRCFSWPSLLGIWEAARITYVFGARYDGNGGGIGQLFRPGQTRKWTI